LIGIDDKSIEKQAVEYMVSWNSVFQGYVRNPWVQVLSSLLSVLQSASLHHSHSQYVVTMLICLNYVKRAKKNSNKTGESSCEARSMSKLRYACACGGVGINVSFNVSTGISKQKK
jgi:hypothetical protein